MATNFPTSLDSFTNPTGTDRLGDQIGGLTHSGFHSAHNDAIEALEAKVGVNGSAVTTTHDYKLSEITGSDKAVGKTATQTLTNKTLSGVTISGTVTDSGTTTKTGTLDATGATVSVTDSLFSIKDNADATKIVKFENSGITTATTRTKTFQDNNGTIYETGGTDVSIADGGTGQSTKTLGFDALSPLSTKGDLLGHDGTNNVRVAVGSNNQILIADSSQTAGFKWAAAGTVNAGKIEVDTTEVTMTNGQTTTETTLFDTTISAGTLSTNNGIRGSVFFSGLGIQATDTLTLRVKYGGSTLATLNIGSASTITGCYGVLDFFIAADGATNAQKSFAKFEAYNNTNGGIEAAGAASVDMSKIIFTITGTGAVDSTSNQTLAVTAQYDDTGASDDLVAEFWSVESVK